MTRIRDALKTLEARQQIQRQPRPDTAPELPESLQQVSDAVAELVLEDAPKVIDPIQRPAKRKLLPACDLPLNPKINDCYLPIAGRISGQLAPNYCNVLLFVTPDAHGHDSFSIANLAQSFALQSPGDVLVVDGDLRSGRLSKAICPSGPGMTEAMLGTRVWPDLIHPTKTPRIDFVSRGSSQVPTFERSEFGWDPLRDNYQAVLIGVSDAGEPETYWLASRCDAVYFIVSRPHARRQASSVAVNALRSCGANVAGCIVTDD